MYRRLNSYFSVLCFLQLMAAALNTSCAPGGNFDLSSWELQLPVGPPNDPTTISSTDLQGCSGYTDESYFFTESDDGALVMKVCGSVTSCGCTKTKDSQHCRTEFRELDPSTGELLNWDPNTPINRLSASLLVVQADDGPQGTVVGQIHIADHVSTKPVCELYYNATGDIALGVEQTRTGHPGEGKPTWIGNVPLGTQFSYEIRYELNELSVGLNGEDGTVFSTFELDAPTSYFKLGNYNQGDTPSEVHFFAIDVTHDESDESWLVGSDEL